MPTIDRFGPYRVFFYMADQFEPPHVHVERDDKMMKIWLHDLGIAINYGFHASELGRILSHVEENKNDYLANWAATFGA